MSFLRLVGGGEESMALKTVLHGFTYFVRLP